MSSVACDQRRRSYFLAKHEIRPMVWSLIWVLEPVKESKMRIYLRNCSHIHKPPRRTSRYVGNITLSSCAHVYLHRPFCRRTTQYADLEHKASGRAACAPSAYMKVMMEVRVRRRLVVKLLQDSGTLCGITTSTITARTQSSYSSRRGCSGLPSDILAIVILLFDSSWIFYSH